MTSHGATLPLLSGEMTLESALEQWENMILDLGLPEKVLGLFVLLHSNRGIIEKIALYYHLGLGPSDTCRSGSVNE